MTIWKKLKPKFWDHRDIASGHHRSLFSFRRKWKLLVFLTTLVAITPLAVQTLLDHNLTTEAIVNEIRQHTYSLVSNTTHTLSFLLSERRAMLALILKEYTPQQLADPSLLANLLKSLKQGGGGFVDLGVVNPQGILFNYAGSYHRVGADLCKEACFQHVVKQGFFISDVIESRRPEQHLVMALRSSGTDESPTILRVTIDIRKFNELLDQLEIGHRGDAFIVNQERLLLTPSRLYGAIFSKVPLELAHASSRIEVFEASDPIAGPLIIGHAAIPDTSMDLVIIHSSDELMADWQKSRHKLVAFLGINIVLIMITILGMATYLVNRIHQADAKRTVALHQAEYANKVASLSRLSAGVAHEINNPLAIIGEKAGLTKDLLDYPLDASRQERLKGLLDDVTAAVKRCGHVTQRLLNFARHMETRFEMVNIGDIVNEIISFLQKEAEFRCIGIFIEIDEKVPQIESGRGNLQQIFLNLINNAFAAIEDGGRLDIGVKMQGPDTVAISFADNGCGISEKDLPHVFEPFFSSDMSKGGTGLGLSVTYGLVRELDGTIRVESRVEEGTCFTIELPLKPEKKKRKDVCSYY